jgi:hypothetical protein
MMPVPGNAIDTDAVRLLKVVTKMDQPIRVILDVGAQILELENVDVVRQWLEMLSDDSTAEAALFFDENDEICVLDRHGCIELLQTSSYATKLGSCLVYLDQCHTRGTDLKLPRDYRAAVTLGANLTKDTLVQGKFPLFERQMSLSS